MTTTDNADLYSFWNRFADCAARLPVIANALPLIFGSEEKIRKLLSLYLVAIAGLFATPLPAQAGLVQIDEPGELVGTTLVGMPAWTLTFSGFSNGLNGTFTNTEQCCELFSFGYQTDAKASATQSLFALLVEPDGTTPSDLVQVDTTSGSTQVFVHVRSDPAAIEVPENTLQVVEDGTFQNLISFGKQDGSLDTIALRSDVDVPEPSALALVGSAFIGFVLVRRRLS